MLRVVYIIGFVSTYAANNTLYYIYTYTTCTYAIQEKAILSTMDITTDGFGKRAYMYICAHIHVYALYDIDCIIFLLCTYVS